MPENLLIEMYKSTMVSRFTDRYNSSMKAMGLEPDELSDGHLALFEIMADEAVLEATVGLLSVFEELARIHRRSGSRCTACRASSATGMPMDVPWPCPVAKIVEKAFDRYAKESPQSYF